MTLGTMTVSLVPRRVDKERSHREFSQIFAYTSRSDPLIDHDSRDRGVRGVPPLKWLTLLSSKRVDRKTYSLQTTWSSPGARSEKKSKTMDWESSKLCPTSYKTIKTPTCCETNSLSYLINYKGFL